MPNPDGTPTEAERMNAYAADVLRRLGPVRFEDICSDLQRAKLLYDRMRPAVGTPGSRPSGEAEP